MTKHIPRQHTIRKVWRQKQPAPERKVQISSAGSAVVTAGSVASLSHIITQNASGAGRIGTTLNMRHFRYCFTVSIPPLGTIRYILFRDTISNGTNPAVTDVLNSATVLSGYNPIYRDNKRFVILKDIVLSNTSDGAFAIQQVHVSNLRQNCKVSYIGNTGSTTDNGPNAYYALSVGQNLVAGTAASNQDWEFEYTDM